MSRNGLQNSRDGSQLELGIYRAEDGLDHRGASRVRDVHGLELLLERRVIRGVAAAAPIVRAEAQRLLQRHRRPFPQT